MSYSNPFATAAATAAPVTATGPCPTVPAVTRSANAPRYTRALYRAMADVVLDGVGDGDEAVPLVKVYPGLDTEAYNSPVRTIDGLPTAYYPATATSWAVTVTCGISLPGLFVYARVYTGLEGDDLTYVDTPKVQSTAGGGGTTMLLLPDIPLGSCVELRCTYVNAEAHTLTATESAAIQVVFERIA